MVFLSQVLYTDQKKETILLVSDEKHEIKTLFAFIRAVQESR